MQPLNIPIFTTGLQNNIKSNVIPDDGFQVLENAFIEQGQVKRRGGLEYVGRLRRVYSLQALGNMVGDTTLFSGASNIFTVLGITDATTIDPGSVTISVAGPGATFTDSSTKNGKFTVTGAGVSATSYIDYLTGNLQLTVTGGAGAAVTISFAYCPGLPVTGIYQKEVTGINREDTIFFDTKYAYQFDSATQAFQELASGTTWTGNSTQLFHCTNWRGTASYDRLFFATNFKLAATDPIRYYNGTWNSFIPAVSSTENLYQARFLIPYYGRLICLNTYEGAAIGSAQNYFNRCTYSQIGSPIAADAFRRDIFGKGGFVDAPVNEAITGYGFLKNTLIVYFETSTWMLRYVGEYGLPFLWENVDSNLGSESYFSAVSLDEGVVSIGDKAITIANPSSVTRIDQKIKNLVFTISNTLPELVVGAREYQKQLLYWCYVDSNSGLSFPNKVLVFNYFENNWATFRDNVTFFGLFQNSVGVTWDSQSTYWDDFNVGWDDGDNQSYYPFIVAGNQQGYIHKYNQSTAIEVQRNLYITAIDRSVTPPRLTITDHNLGTDGQSLDFVYLSGISFIDTGTGASVSTDLNGRIFKTKVVDADTVELFEWDGTIYDDNFSYTPPNGSGTYVGAGEAALLPILNLVTKDFNPYVPVGKGCKFVKANLIFDTSSSGQVSIRTYSDTSGSGIGNASLLQDGVETYAVSGYYLANSEYASHPFYALTNGQFVRLQITLDDTLISDVDIQESNFVLSGMTLYFKPGGKISF